MYGNFLSVSVPCPSATSRQSDFKRLQDALSPMERLLLPLMGFGSDYEGAKHLAGSDPSKAVISSLESILHWGDFSAAYGRVKNTFALKPYLFF